MKPILGPLATRFGSFLVLLLFLASCAAPPTTAPGTEPGATVPVGGATAPSAPLATQSPAPLVVSIRDVTITLPVQSYCPCSINEPSFAAYQDAFPSLKKLPVPESAETQPIQPVIYFQVLDLHNEVQSSFSPEMQIQVQYNQALIDQATELKSNESGLVLLILNHKDPSNQYWYVAPGFQLNMEKKLGTTTISEWTSHICWGVRPPR